jgi:hypothetical protein
MKKLFAMILALTLALILCCGALADETPQPEGGKKFESNWAIFDMTVNIVYEEEGYRIYMKSSDPYEHKGTEWEYSCYYVEDKDALVSVSSSKNDYTEDPETGDMNRGDPIYQGMDEEGQASVFTIDENGKLEWQCGRGDDGIDLEFTNIGTFDGFWMSEDGKISADIYWSDSEVGDEYGYTVYLHDEGDESFANYTLHGLYNPNSGKLVTTGSVSINRLNAEGGYDEEVVPADPNEPWEIIFSSLGGGRILLERDNGYELVYDIMGHPQG